MSLNKVLIIGNLGKPDETVAFLPFLKRSGEPAVQPFEDTGEANAAGNVDRE